MADDTVARDWMLMRGMTIDARSDGVVVEWNRIDGVRIRARMPSGVGPREIVAEARRQEIEDLQMEEAIRHRDRRAALEMSYPCPSLPPPWPASPPLRRTLDLTERAQPETIEVVKEGRWTKTITRDQASDTATVEWSDGYQPITGGES